MKKFLSLAMVALMGVSAFAANRFFIEDFTVTKEDLGSTKFRVMVGMESDVETTAWQVNFEYPEGMTCTAATAQSDMTFSYTNEDGDAKSSEIALNKNADNTMFLAASMVVDYDEDGNKIGVKGWDGGVVYTKMFRLTFTIAEDFAGGQIRIYAGRQANSNDASLNHDADEWITNVTSEYEPAPEVEALTGDIAFDEVVDGVQAWSFSGNTEDVTSTYVVTDAQGNVVAEGEGWSVVLPAAGTEDATYTVTVTVTPNDTEAYTGEVTASTDVTVAGVTPEPDPDPDYTKGAWIVINGQYYALTDNGDGNYGYSWNSEVAGDQVYIVIDGIAYKAGEKNVDVANGVVYTTVADSEGVYVINATGSTAAAVKVGQDGTVLVSFTNIDLPTAIEDILAGENVQSVRYYNVAGQELSEMQNGINIVVATMNDGSTVVSKVRK